MFFERILLSMFYLGVEGLPWAQAEEVKIHDVGADKGTNMTIPCGALATLTSPNVQWVHRGNKTHHKVLVNGSLLLTKLKAEDAGLYECWVENETAFVDRVNLTVRTEPPPLVNVTVHASTILALILWNVAGDGGHPIIDFTAQYRSALPINGSLEPWRPISPNHISPNSRQIDVYHLDTNASYWFRVWATNVLGPGPPVEVLATTLYSDQEAGLPWAQAEEVKIHDVGADKGTNMTIPCGALATLTSPNVQWVHRGNKTHHKVLVNGSLLLTKLKAEDAGLYECWVENETAFVDRVNLTVRTEPPPLVNVTVHASTILALILWNVAGDGGHPIIDFTAQYRSALPINGSLEPWRPISPNHISPNSRQIDVYHLDTNASYWFRVWATNVLGPGPPVEVLATTLYSDQEAELYKRFFEGAETFDTRTWVAAVCVVMGTLVVLTAGTCAVLCREWRRNDYMEDQDVMELVPNIILNPGFMEMDPIRPREPTASSIIRSTECPGPGKPRRV